MILLSSKKQITLADVKKERAKMQHYCFFDFSARADTPKDLLRMEMRQFKKLVNKYPDLQHTYDIHAKKYVTIMWVK